MVLPQLNQFIKHPRVVLGFDPGECTGVSIFNGAEMIEADQLNTKTLDQSFEVLSAFFDAVFSKHALHIPVEVVIEDYRVYGWKTEEHSFAGLHTPKLIGMLVTFCISHKIPYTLRMAQPAKAFVTDEKLEGWGLWEKGKRHARDAMRHAIFQMIFPDKDISKSDT